MIIIRIITTIIIYFVLMFLSINLLGLFVRGLFPNTQLNELQIRLKDLDSKNNFESFIEKEIRKREQGEKFFTVFDLLSIIGYLYITFRIWNIGVTAVAIVLMLVRLPSLLWEIKTGQEFNRVASALSMPKNALYYINNFLTFAALPALYYFLYYF